MLVSVLSEEVAAIYETLVSLKVNFTKNLSKFLRVDVLLVFRKPHLENLRKKQLQDWGTLVWPLLPSSAAARPSVAELLIVAVAFAVASFESFSLAF